MNEVLEMLTRGDTGSALANWEMGLLTLMLALVIGHVIGWVYMLSHTGLSYSRMFVASLMVLPVIVSLVMTLMTGNIVIAFGLLAVFAVVRFRNVLKDTRDTTFVLWAIVEGMAVGTHNFSTALLGGLFVAALYIYIRLTSFGSRHHYDVILSVQWAGEEVPTKALRPILGRHAARTQLASQRRAGPSELDLSYRLLLRDPSRTGELLGELETVPGVAHASLYLREDESEI